MIFMKGTVSLKGKNYEVFTIDVPSDNYLLLEIEHKDQKSPRGFVVLKFETRKAITVVRDF